MNPIVKYWKNHSLSLVLTAIFLAMCISTWPMGSAMWDGKSSYTKFWIVQTVWSLEADVFGAILLVIFTKFLREKDSAQSKETRRPVAEEDGDVLEIELRGTLNELKAAEQYLTQKFVTDGRYVMDRLEHSHSGVVRMRFINEIEREARVGLERGPI